MAIKNRRIVFVLVILAYLILPISKPGRAEKKLGVSAADYTDIEVLPNTVESGGFTVFNVGDEDLVVYAEVKHPPGDVIIRWKVSGEWETTNELPLKAGERGYGAFSIFLGELTQGKYYSWSIVIGYFEDSPSSHVVAQVGIPIRMVWPFPEEAHTSPPTTELPRVTTAPPPLTTEPPSSQNETAPPATATTSSPESPLKPWTKPPSLPDLLFFGVIAFFFALVIASKRKRKKKRKKNKPTQTMERP